MNRRSRIATGLRTCNAANLAQQPWPMSMQDLIEAARVSKAWPFQEAQRLLKRYPDGTKPGGEPVLFETGYGPSGLPHIGTFGEVLRTTMVRRAFELMSDIPTKLLAFSDDMDGPGAAGSGLVY